MKMIVMFDFSLGAKLAEIKGFNQNKGLGWLLRQAYLEEGWSRGVNVQSIVQAATAESQQIWIGRF